MKKLSIFSNVFILAGLISCSSDPKQTATADSVNPVTASANPASLKPFEPDNNWTLPTEVVSQYGPSGIIRDVVIDQNGIIWMAAWDGVVSYDQQTKQFTNHTLKKGLSHHRVYSVMQDNKGNMWFGTMGAGAYKYDGNTFTNYSTNNGMIDNVVFDLFEDSQGNIWFATSEGASMFDGKSFLNIDSTSNLRGEVYAVSQDRTGTTWLGTSDGLFTYKDNKVVELMTEFDTHYSNVRDIYCNHLATMYFGASGGLYMCNAIPGSKNEITLINNKFTGYVCEDQSGNLLLTSDGLFRYIGTQMETIVGDKNNLGICGACEAQDGTIWYGAMDGLHSVRDGKDAAYKMQ